MRKHSVRLAAVVLAVIGVGCNGTGAGQTFTCDFASSDGICFAWTSTQDLTQQQVSALQAQCTQGSGSGAGTFSTGTNCSATNRVGTCAIAEVGVPGVTYAWVLYSPAYTTTTGQSFCTEVGGTWTPG